MEPSQLVNRLGKYLYKNIESAYNIEYRPHECDISMTVLYEIPRDIMRMYPQEFKDVMDTLNEMNISLSLVGYGDKVRMNLISEDTGEQTLGQKIYPMDKLLNSREAKQLILRDIHKILNKSFEKYEFIF